MKTSRGIIRYVVLAFVAACLTLAAGFVAPFSSALPNPAEAQGSSLSVSEPAPSEAAELPSPVQPPAPLKPVVEAPPAEPTYRVGDQGSVVLDLEAGLKALHYDPGTVDGTFDGVTKTALFAFQKVHGLTVDGIAGPAVLEAIKAPTQPVVIRPAGQPSRVEVDLKAQLMTVYRNGSLVLVTHISTGNNETFCDGGRCRKAVTPSGDFKFQRRIKGWRTAELGRIYNPVYFTEDGVAVHGSASVRLKPASHGCVRIPMHTADLFPTLVENGTPIHLAN